MSEIQFGETFKGAVERIFSLLYGPDFQGYAVLSNYSAVIEEERLGADCLVFPDKPTAEQATDLVYGDGPNDSDNLLVGGLWAGQRIAVGKTNELNNMFQAMSCQDYWSFEAKRTVNPDQYDEQTWTINAIRKIFDKEIGELKTTDMYTFRFYNGDFNNWQGNWEIRVGDRWVPVKKLKKYLDQGMDINDAYQMLLKAQESGFSPKNQLGVFFSKGVRQQGYTTKGYRG